MSQKNALIGNYDSVTLFDKPALFTCLRVDRSTVPSGLFAYDIRHNDGGMAASVEPRVSANHMGTIITSESLDFGKDGYITLNDDNCGLNFASNHNCTTITEYQKYLQEISQTQTAEPEQTQEMTMSM